MLINNLIFEILIYFDSGYLQPDTSYIKKKLVLTVIS